MRAAQSLRTRLSRCDTLQGSYTHRQESRQTRKRANKDYQWSACNSCRRSRLKIAAATRTYPHRCRLWSALQQRASARQTEVLVLRASNGGCICARWRTQKLADQHQLDQVVVRPHALATGPRHRSPTAQPRRKVSTDAVKSKLWHTRHGQAPRARHRDSGLSPLAQSAPYHSSLTPRFSTDAQASTSGGRTLDETTGGGTARRGSQ